MVGLTAPSSFWKGNLRNVTPDKAGMTKIIWLVRRCCYKSSNHALPAEGSTVALCMVLNQLAAQNAVVLGSQFLPFVRLYVAKAYMASVPICAPSSLQHTRYKIINRTRELQEIHECRST
jgi:hypothetical protein